MSDPYVWVGLAAIAFLFVYAIIGLVNLAWIIIDIAHRRRNR